LRLADATILLRVTTAWPAILAIPVWPSGRPSRSAWSLVPSMMLWHRRHEPSGRILVIQHIAFPDFAGSHGGSPSEPPRSPGQGDRNFIKRAYSSPGLWEGCHMEEDPRPVAVIAISGDSNEDHWMQAIRHAEVAATEAAVEAGIPEANVTVSVEANGRLVVVSGPDGRTFEAWVVTDRLRTEGVVRQRRPNGLRSPQTARVGALEAHARQRQSAYADTLHIFHTFWAQGDQLVDVPSLGCLSTSSGRQDAYESATV